jgi:hypothetical protein
MTGLSAFDSRNQQATSGVVELVPAVVPAAAGAVLPPVVVSALASVQSLSSLSREVVPVVEPLPVAPVPAPVPEPPVEVPASVPLDAPPLLPPVLPESFEPLA